jgi:hypothetical protein
MKNTNLLATFLFFLLTLTGCSTSMKANPSIDPQVYLQDPAVLTVGSQNCDYTTIKEALTHVDTTKNTIAIMDVIHTEAGIEIDKPVTISGLGVNTTILQAADSLEHSSDRVFLIKENGIAHIDNMTIRHGKITEVPRCGAGILNLGDLTVDRCIIRDNYTTYGIAIDNKGKMTVMNSDISHNKGLKRPLKDEMAAKDCSGSGAAIKIHKNSEAFIANCLISDNFSYGKGGGVHIACEGKATIANCTITGNTCEKEGGGISLRGDLNLYHCTITDNKAYKGGGLYVSGKLNFSGNIIALNKAGDFIPGSTFGIYGKAIVETNTYNLIGDGLYESALSGDPLLLPLSDNGGPTMTFALDKNSPALNQIPVESGIQDTDQRGADRTKKPSDLGAFEK